MKRAVAVKYHTEADKPTVNRLAQQYGGILTAAVDANKKRTGTAQAVQQAEGYLLVAYDQTAAAKDGFQIDAPYLILGVPESSELGRKIIGEMRAANR